MPIAATAQPDRCAAGAGQASSKRRCPLTERARAAAVASGATCMRFDLVAFPASMVDRITPAPGPEVGATPARIRYCRGVDEAGERYRLRDPREAEAIPG